MSADSLEIRVSPFNRSRVSIIAIGRKLRFKQYREKVYVSAKQFCPFCPGNEEYTPPAILVLTKEMMFKKDSNGFRVRNWLVRIFPNEYPALSRNINVGAGKNKYTAYGYHEVIVETPLHEEDMYLEKTEHTYYAFLALRKRIKEIINDPNIENILVIKNSGFKAGASIKHPHLQLFATTFTPPIIANEIKGFKECMEKHGKCPLCEIVEKQSPRTVLDTKYFKVETRYAPQQPYELIIIPKKHEKNMLKTSNEELKDLAWILNSIVKTLKHVLKKNSINYNYWIHMVFKNIGEYHWHIELQPLIETWGGCEKGSGVHIVTVKPEDAANKLRKNLKRILQGYRSHRTV